MENNNGWFFMYDKSIPCPVLDCNGQLIKQYHNGKEMSAEDLGETAEISQRHYIMCNHCGAKGVLDSHAKIVKPAYKDIDKIQTVHSNKLKKAEHIPLEKQHQMF